MINRICLCSFFILATLSAAAQSWELRSPAGKVVVLVDTTQTPNAVTLYKVAVKPIRVFTAWSVNIYADEATAKADIAAKGWKYTPAETPAK